MRRVKDDLKKMKAEKAAAKKLDEKRSAKQQSVATTSKTRGKEIQKRAAATSKSSAPKPKKIKMLQKGTNNWRG